MSTNEGIDGGEIKMNETMDKSSEKNDNSNEECQGGNEDEGSCRGNDESSPDSESDRSIGRHGGYDRGDQNLGYFDDEGGSDKQQNERGRGSSDEGENYYDEDGYDEGGHYDGDGDSEDVDDSDDGGHLDKTNQKRKRTERFQVIDESSSNPTKRRKEKTKNTQLRPENNGFSRKPANSWKSKNPQKCPWQKKEDKETWRRAEEKGNTSNQKPAQWFTAESSKAPKDRRRTKPGSKAQKGSDTLAPDHVSQSKEEGKGLKNQNAAKKVDAKIEDRDVPSYPTPVPEDVEQTSVEQVSVEGLGLVERALADGYQVAEEEGQRSSVEMNRVVSVPGTPGHLAGDDMAVGNERNLEVTGANDGEEEHAGEMAKEPGMAPRVE
ncbi:hypothetical protein IFR05_009163 [Cadophora sp. M221]|nr:hypothetical protein IFR05_009163 [Cadophora sp. M221]